MIPYLKDLKGLFIVNSIFGSCTSGIDTGSAAWIVEMWPDDANVYLQTFQAAFAIGLVVGPLLGKPFVAPERNASADLITNGTAIAPDEGMLYAPYTILSFYFLSAAGLHLLMHFLMPYKQVFRSVVKERQLIDPSSTDSEEDLHSISLLQKDKTVFRSYVIVFLICSMLSFQQIGEQTTINFLTTFALEVNVDKPDAELMVSNN